MFAGRSLVLYALLLGLALAIFACGGDSGSDGEDGEDGDIPATTTLPNTAGTLPPGINLTQIPSQVLTQIPPQVLTAIPQVTIQTGAAGNDACAVVTRDEASQVLGGAVSPATTTAVISQQVGPGLNVAIASCEYVMTSMPRSLQVTVWRSAAGGTPAQIRQIVEQFICLQKERVTTVGDFACWNDATHKELQVLKGSSLIILSINESGGSDRTMQLISLAARAVTRVP